MNDLRKAVAVLSLLPFLAQTIGAAEIAGLMGPAAARAAMAPPPGRFAPPRQAAPKPAPVPSGPSLIRRAGDRFVSALAAGSALLDRAMESHFSGAPAWNAPAPVASPVQSDERMRFSALAPAPLPPEPAAAAAAGSAVEAVSPAAPAADRIFIAGGSGIIGAYGELESPLSEVLPLRFSAYKDRFVGFWSRGEGVSLRVDYLRPWGINKADAEGFTMLFKGRSPHRIAAPGGVPPLLRREHPVYFAGDEVTLELTLRNDGAAPLSGLVVHARQEGLMLDGSAGPALDEGQRLPVAELAPGAELRLRWTIRMSRRGTAAVNFEQTAVRVTGTGDDAKTYANIHQAGIVDPPAP